MANELAVLDSGLPAYLKTAELDDATKALMGSGNKSTKRISIRGGVWRMMMGGKEIAKNEDRTMNVVVVAAAKISRTFYAGVYVEGAATAPSCWSPDGEVPDPKSKAPQAKRCIDCAQNIKGSGQGESRACRYNQRLAVVLGNDIGGDVFQLQLPAKSIFGAGEPGKWPMQTYSRMIGGKGIPITAVVTEMRFDTDEATPKLTFKPSRVLESEEHMVAIRQGATEEAQRAITMTVAQVDGVEGDDEPFETPKAVTAAAPVAEVPKEPIKEPTKRSKKEEEVTPKKDLTSVLDEWDDS